MQASAIHGSHSSDGTEDTSLHTRRNRLFLPEHFRSNDRFDQRSHGVVVFPGGRNRPVNEQTVSGFDGSSKSIHQQFFRNASQEPLILF